MLAKIAGRHDLGTFLQGDSKKTSRTKGRLAVSICTIQGEMFADIVAFAAFRQTTE